MYQKKKYSIMLMITIMLCSILNLTTLADTNGKTTITILQTSDLHGRIYPHDYATDSEDADTGLAKIQTLIEQERAKNDNIILMDTGDTVQDNSAELFNDLPAHPMIQGLNLMGYDVWAIGNHEFNFELDFLKRNIEAFEGTVLSANIYKDGTDNRFVEGYKIFDRQGVKVAVIGMIPPHIPIWEASAPEHFSGLVFTDPMEETAKVLKEIEGQYDVLVGAYHLGPDGEHGFEGVESIANSFPEFDVIFCGHAHSEYNEVINDVHIIEPGKYGWALAKAEIDVIKKENGYDVIDTRTENIETEEVETSEAILDEFEFVHETSIEDANTVVGSITQDFIDGVDYITGSDEVTTIPRAQIEDTAIIDLINEVQMYYADAEISSAALFNFGSNLKKGDFKKKDVAYIYKYTNTLVGVNITGENLLKYMEWSASYYNTAQEGDVTVSFDPEIRGYNYDMFSGIDYQIDISREPGQRIVNATINGEAIDLNKTYKLAVNNYRFGTLMGLGLATEEDKYYDSYEVMQDNGRIRSLIVDYTIKVKDGKLTPSTDNNWRIVGFDFNHPNKEEVFQLVKDGTLLIPTSEDGRTKNVKAINIDELEASGIALAKETHSQTVSNQDSDNAVESREDATQSEESVQPEDSNQMLVIFIITGVILLGVVLVFVKKNRKISG